MQAAPNTQHDASESLQQQVQESIAGSCPLNIVGGGSKNFLGLISDAAPLDVGAHRGIISYEPTELVITARAGTPLGEIETLLAEHRQSLPFEPPRHSPGATIGGAVASALSGPARPFAGAVRDYVLGCKVINGHGQVLQFGGQVMKNVAGYDVTRLMTGARGTLGVLLDVSIKVLPVTEQQVTIESSLDLADALATMLTMKGSNYPVTAACYHEGRLSLRLSGSETGLLPVIADIKGDRVDNGVWDQLRDQRHPYFDTDTLWRLAVPAGTPALDIDGDWLYDWAGEQRWLKTSANAADIRESVARHGGHAQLYKAPRELQQSAGVEHPLTKKISQLHTDIKHSFDPHGIFNPGRLYPDL
jgi:glycolate oxidase FAD binding subunit